MRNFKTFLFLFFSIATLHLSAQPCKQVIGYYPGWQWYDRAKLVQPSTLDYSKYTIINFAFFKPNADGTIEGTDAWSDENILQGDIDWSTTPPSHFPNTSLVDIAHNNNVKVVISVGGWTLSANFPTIAASATLRAMFAHECARLISFYNLDGIDIDWEYPGFVAQGGTVNDKVNFTLFLQSIRDSIDNYGNSVGKSMLLTAAMSASKDRMADIEWNNVTPLLDYINLMTYDYFGTWDATANHNAPLHQPLQGAASFNLDSSVTYLMQAYNVPSIKIATGVAFYGRSLKTTGTPALFAPITGAADNATFSEDGGSPMYYNILKHISVFNTNWDNAAKVPYLTGVGSLNTFVSYDDEQSIGLKARYILDKNLAGAIIWEITGDYVETFPGSGVIAGTPLVDTLNAVFCNAPTGLVVQQENVSEPFHIQLENQQLTIVFTETKPAAKSVRILNASGQNVTGDLLTHNAELKLHVKNLTRGIYFVEIFTDEKTFSKKIFIS